MFDTKPTTFQQEKGEALYHKPVVFVGYSEYFSNSFYLRKDAGSYRFLNL